MRWLAKVRTEEEEKFKFISTEESYYRFLYIVKAIKENDCKWGNKIKDIIELYPKLEEDDIKWFDFTFVPCNDDGSNPDYICSIDIMVVTKEENLLCL